MSVKKMKHLTAANQELPEIVFPNLVTEPHEECRGVSSNGDFRRILLEATGETFALLGKRVERSIYVQLGETFKIAEKDIPFHIEKFVVALEEIFGTGASLLEIEMMKKLHKKVGPEFKYQKKNENLTFAEYLAAIRVFLSVRTSTKSKPNEYFDYKFC